MTHQASITRAYRFAAAHRLHTSSLSDDVNLKIYGKCNNLNGHGHNYTVLVTLKGELDAKTGQVANMNAMDRLIHEKVVKRFDHQHLNYDPAFQDLVTTGENLARFIWNLLVDQLPSGQLEKIGLIETRDNFFEYRGHSLQSSKVENK